MSAFDDALLRLEEQKIRRIKLGVTDIDGVLRGKYISLEKFAASASGFGFCDVIFGWDIADALYDNCKFTGWHTGYPDARARIDYSTFRTIPWEPGTAFFLVDLLTSNGEIVEVSPRQVLQKVIAQAGAAGFRARFAAEYEFWIFRETPQTVREKDFHKLVPLSPGMCGYSVLRASQSSQLVLDLIDQLAGFDIPLEGFHTETGPGVFEAAITVDDALAAADKAALFKTAVKEICARHGVIPTFMAKWNADLPGSSGHLHQSLCSCQDGRNLFFEENTDAGTSPLMRKYIGGLVKFMPEFMAMIAPTVNSYKRTVPGTWAPINATWATDNRTTAVRAIPASVKSTRIELRLSAADMNPYLAIAASLAAGLEGIALNLEPPPPSANGYAAVECEPLPRNLDEAVCRLRNSEVARNWFGSSFVDHYADTRVWEIRQFARHVTDWELSRYFEAI
ncbi:MAG TPA: glutamine synthetase family protein [Bryobacteraceae bacterium]|nr:glutamine synthetase family protein [Bryobacteraceae bacterium]